jgi:hypothetical protein
VTGADASPLLRPNDITGDELHITGDELHITGDELQEAAGARAATAPTTLTLAAERRWG